MTTIMNREKRLANSMVLLVASVTLAIAALNHVAVDGSTITETTVTEPKPLLLQLPPRHRPNLHGKNKNRQLAINPFEFMCILKPEVSRCVALLGDDMEVSAFRDNGCCALVSRSCGTIVACLFQDACSEEFTDMDCPSKIQMSKKLDNVDRQLEKLNQTSEKGWETTGKEPDGGKSGDEESRTRRPRPRPRSTTTPKPPSSTTSEPPSKSTTHKPKRGSSTTKKSHRTSTTSSSNSTQEPKKLVSKVEKTEKMAKYFDNKSQKHEEEEEWKD